jgi:hypothetical protein
MIRIELAQKGRSQPSDKCCSPERQITKVELATSFGYW